MTTTVAVKEETMQMLQEVKLHQKAESFDEVIKKLILASKKPKKSHFGILPGLGKFKREELDRFD